TTASARSAEPLGARRQLPVRRRPVLALHEEIDWAATAGITQGYADGTFHPADPVSRQAMAAVSQRLYDLTAGTHAVRSTVTAASTTATTFTNVPLTSVTVTIPPGTTGRIL